MFRPKNETEDLTLSLTQNCETLIKQTQSKPQEAPEFQPTKSRKTFSYISPISIEGYKMVGLAGLEVLNSIFNITEENTKF